MNAEQARKITDAYIEPDIYELIKSAASSGKDLITVSKSSILNKMEILQIKGYILEEFTVSHGHEVFTTLNMITPMVNIRW